MPTEPSEPFPNLNLRTPEASKGSAAELQAKYQRIKQRQRVLAAIGILFLIALYLFLRHVLPWLGTSRQSPL